MIQSRRDMLRTSSVGLAIASSNGFLGAALATEFQLRYLIGSCLYGYETLENILPEVAKAGAAAIDIWPKVHGNQREQLDELGEERFAALLKQHRTALGCITQYKLGPFGLQDEMRLAQRLGCRTIVTGAKGPANLRGAELKQAVAKFLEELKPHLAVAEETGVTIAIENHAKNLIESPDSLRYLAELRPSKHLGIAFAPYHLPQDPQLLAELLRDILPAMAVYYAWQHGHGSMTKLPKEEELLQLPGRGELDFQPMLAELKQGNYQGWTEIFMHPFPRGVPILETVTQVTDEINHSRLHLEKLMSGV
jgi:sugar phosphate isomerase/epimerase